MADDLDDTIRDNASGPSEVSVDGQTVRQHSLKDQMDADRHLSSKQAAKKKLGVRMTKVVPPGAS